MYWLEIPTDDPDILETAFQILSDWAYAVSFAPDEVGVGAWCDPGRVALKAGVRIAFSR